MTDTSRAHRGGLRNDTPILTRAGWVTMGGLQEGDEVVASDGRWTKVVGVFPQGAQEAFQVSLSDVSSLVVGGGHPWKLWGRRKGVVVHDTLTTAELVGDRYDGSGNAKWRVPMVAPLEGESVDLPLEPYVLGLFLGNAIVKRRTVLVHKQEVQEAFRASGWEVTGRSVRGLGKVIRTLGLEDARCHSKFVPEVYLRARTEDRLALLQALCDTKGTVSKMQGRPSFNTSSPQLSCDFALLVCSLGGKYTWRARSSTYMWKGENRQTRVSWETHFRLPGEFQPFTLPRKRDLLSPPSLVNQPRRCVRDIEFLGLADMTCVSLDAPDGLFAAGRDFVVTHAGAAR